jgi:hypothetical protein
MAEHRSFMMMNVGHKEYQILLDGIISQGKIENVNSVKKIKLGTNFIISCDAVISMTKENHALKSST